MKFFTYIVCWDEVHENVKQIESRFKETSYPYAIINSGNQTSDGWHNVGDIRYYRQFYYALSNFDFNYDYMGFICGDVSYWNWAGFLDRFNSVINSYQNISLYAPHLTNEPWTEDSSCIGKVPTEDKLLISIQTDGIALYIHREVVQILLDYFKYLESKIDITTITSGWGMDMIWCSIAIANNGWILRDNEHILNHPAGSSYNHSKASAELELVLNAFYEYVESIGVDPDVFGLIHSNIYKRMGQDPAYIAIEDFYKDIPPLFKYNNEINYHTIFINDERISNRFEIDNKVLGNKQSISSFYPRSAEHIEDFKTAYPKFKIKWEGYKIGEFGNFGSHYLAWKYLTESNLENLLIFEDDVVMHDYFIEKYNIAMNNVPQDYDVLSIFIDDNQLERFDNSDYISYYIAKGYQDWSTLCYVISKAGAEKFLKYIEEVGFDHPTDWFIFRKGHSGTFNVYTLPPYFKSPLEIDKRYVSQVQ